MTSERKKGTEPDTSTKMPEATIESRPNPNATVVWDDKDMQTSFANVINVVFTREEFSLFFGTNQSWNLAETANFVVKLGNRIMLTPHAVTRLQTLLAERMAEYEKRFGAITR
jgi:hypothetical protein